MTVIDYLTGLSARGTYSHAIYDVVETLLEKEKHGLARDALTAFGFLVITAELLLEQSVSALYLLLLAKLEAVLARLLSAETVRSGRYGTSVHSALFGRASVALQK